MLKYQGLLKTSMRPMLKPCAIPMVAHARTISSSSRAQQSKTPTAPLVLGAAGLLPFVGTAAVSAVMPETVFLMMEVQAVYSTTILSFMGAVHWGLAMAPGSSATAASASNIAAPETASANEGSTQSEATRYALSTVPALVAFASVVTCNVPTSLLVHAVGYNALLAFDMAAGRRGLVPAWYPGLRLWLTGVVTASIASTLFIAYKRETEEESEEASEEEER
ncbi:hypothetical protein HDU81_010517 [Chytriomyces hyalinus]|nr:hypothetical protein HDU81_010517 [Chytriomyces hyalinus]